MDWTDASAANGPKVMAWLRERRPRAAIGKVAGKRGRDWELGTQAQFPTLDRVLTRLDVHPSELPDDVWEDEVDKLALAREARHAKREAA